MSNFLIIFFCLAFGYIFRYFKLIKKGGHLAINTWIIYVGLPSIALKYIPQIDWTFDYLYTAILPFICFGISYVFFHILNRWMHYSKRTLYTLIIVAGLSNTSFVGFPLVSSYYGEEYLKVAIVSDQVTFFILSLFGVILAASVRNIFATQREKTLYIVKRITTFPPLIACVLALVFGKYLVNKQLNDVFSSFAATVSPMALFSIGIQLNFKRITQELNALFAGIALKLVVIPLVCISLFYFLNLSGNFFRVSVFEMAMPCLVASSIIVEKFSLNVKFANTLIGISIIIGLALSYLWYSVINTLL